MIKSQKGIFWYVHFVYQGGNDWSFFIIEEETKEAALEIAQQLIENNPWRYPLAGIPTAKPLADIVAESRRWIRELGL